MSFSDLLHNFETFHDNHAGVKQEYAKLYRLSSQPSQTSNLPTHKHEVHFLSLKKIYIETKKKKNPENINSCVMSALREQDASQIFPSSSLLPCGLWRVQIQKSAQKTEKRQKKNHFVTHMFKIRTIKLCQVTTQSYTEEETQTDRWRSSEHLLRDRREKRWTAESHERKRVHFSRRCVLMEGPGPDGSQREPWLTTLQHNFY